jgi:hypothetical protein
MAHRAGRGAEAVNAAMRARLVLLAVWPLLLAGAGSHAYAHGAQRAADRVAEEGTPRCFGAASRDPGHPCSNPSLRLSVVPTPRQARSLPNAPCLLRPFDGGPHVCAFGALANSAQQTVVLIGDSHAGDWRGALRVVAESKSWLGLSITHSSCPLSTATRELSEAKRWRCDRWRRRVRGGFGTHPEVHTVFVSALSGGQGVVARDGTSVFETEVAGYIAAWHALPPSVRHIVVLRDTPKMRTETAACVERAIARHVPAGASCALPRGAALDRDPLPVAASRMHSRRVQVIDLTRVFCGDVCFLVIGGALVYKDSHHLTAMFSATLGPLLLRRLNGLMARWH